jgi:thioredoxin type arsenate reductase
MRAGGLTLSDPITRIAMSSESDGHAPTRAGHAAAFITLPPRRVIFLCTHNSARSQMAEGFARAMAPEDAEVLSAGTQPTNLHPLAVEVMAEVGIDISAQRSKPLEEIPWQTADTIVSVCGDEEEACPAVASTVRRVHWPLPDPAAAPESIQIDVFRQIRDELRWRVACLWPRGD